MHSMYSWLGLLAAPAEVGVAPALGVSLVPRVLFSAFCLEGSTADMGEVGLLSWVGDVWLDPGWVDGRPALPAAWRLITSCRRAEFMLSKTVTRAFSRAAASGETVGWALAGAWLG